MNTTVTHTPRPWTVKPDYGKENVYLLWDKDSNSHDETSPEVMDKNATLIAAAPELLEALRGMLEWARRVSQSNPGQEVFNAVVAIAKAEGR